MKRVAISQSNYIPWKGYFDLINMVDEFILYDDVQYTSQDWRNRNQIKTQHGLKWLSIPVESKGKRLQKINKTKVSGNHWRKKHWESIKRNYSKAPFFKEYEEIFEVLYQDNNDEYLTQINYRFITAISTILGINTKIRLSSEFDLVDGRIEKLLGICQDCDANVYLSGPSAKGYLDETMFVKNNIQVEWIDYGNYPKYQQMFQPFEHKVSILDLIFNKGRDANKFMKSFSWV